jgi:hypothetical protein
VSGTDALVDNMRYILTMPELCDVTFHVGPQLLPVHGLKAVIGSRSQILQDKILQQYNQQLRRSKKRENCNREDVNIFINNYDFEVFKQFVDFLHTGSIVMDATTVVGLAIHKLALIVSILLYTRFFILLFLFVTGLYSSSVRVQKLKH